MQTNPSSPLISMASSWIDDHRDHVVVPWISLGSSTVGAAAINSHDQSVTSSHPISDGSEHSRHQRQQHFRYASQQQSCKILSLLATRERIGIRSAAAGVSPSRVGWLQEGRNVSTTSLAMSGAW